MKNQIRSRAAGASLSILFSLSLVHCLNDLLQSVVSASYPVIRDTMTLSFAQIGLLSLIYQVCASVFQPVFGVFFDKHPSTRYLTVGNLSTMAGLLILGFSTSMWMLFVAVAFIGLGSSIIHPEASRLTHFASEGRHGLAQSIFQVGGYFGGSIGPLLAAAVVAPFGQRYIAVFAVIAFLALFIRGSLVRWQRHGIRKMRRPAAKAPVVHRVRLSKKKIYFSLALLLVLIFSKYVYMASLSSFYTFYLIEKFGVTTARSQIFLFAFLFAGAVGTLLGGPIGDRVGRKWVIWVSILGTAPFSLLMPYVELGWTCVMSILIGLILSSAFSAILVYAQELLPTKVGLISGLFFGLAFGSAGIAAAVLGDMADTRGIEYVYQVCAFMPLLGIVALLLPNVKMPRKTAETGLIPE
ncbi:MAG: MFS transporter [Rikenellaceae bacterium]|jgi:FSR family fosmidomycin resistance protein-like MFS transporter|nr:MFS transporter [Rikenellaceae bacterium]